jgi:hypothetical protein
VCNCSHTPQSTLRHTTGQIASYNDAKTPAPRIYPGKMIYTTQRIEGILSVSWLKGTEGNFHDEVTMSILCVRFCERVVRFAITHNHNRNSANTRRHPQRPHQAQQEQ